MNKKCIKIFDLEIVGFDTDYVFQSIEKNNYFYEGKLLDKWLKYLTDVKYIFDLGANLGNHTLYWACNLEAVKIYSFEPYKPNYELLKENIEINKLKNVEPVNMGVGDRKTKAVIKSFDDSNFGATTLKDADEEDTETINIIDLDSFVKNNNVSRVDFIKIDTEGFEEKIISGMQNVIVNFKPILWIEVSDSSYEVVFEKLKEAGYIVVDIEGFNVLFIHKENSNEIKEYDYKKAIGHMFNYLEKVNIYYNNYEKTKGWLGSKNQELLDIREKYKNLQNQNKEFADKYRNSQEIHSTLKLEYNSLREDNKNLKLEHNSLREDSSKLKLEYRKLMEDVYTSNKEELEILNNLKGMIQKLETQNNYLKSENLEYQRKMQIIKDTFVGKILVWGYRTLKKLKRKFK